MRTATTEDDDVVREARMTRILFRTSTPQRLQNRTPTT